MKLFNLTRKYMNDAGDGSSGGAVDRGDVVDNSATEAAAAEQAVVEAAAAEAAAAEAAAAEAAAAEKKEEKDDQPRDESGKFAKKEGKGVIPVDRHEKVLERERAAREAAERRAQELEKQIQQVDKTEAVKDLDKQIEELEEKLESARLDGDKAKALQYSKELRTLERQVVKMEADSIGAQSIDQARESIRMDMVIEKLEIDYPMLNEQSEEYDQDLVDLVLATQNDLIRRERMAGSYALEAAVKKVMGKLAVASEKAPEAGLKAAKTDEDRNKAQLQKNIETAKKQPASMKETGLDSDSKGQKGQEADVTQMSFEEFNALPEATKAKLRGDFSV